MKIWMLGFSLMIMNSLAVGAPILSDCAQILRDYNLTAQAGDGKVLISSMENAVGTRLMQLNDYGTIRHFEARCTPQGGLTVCEGFVISSQARAAADGQAFDVQAKQKMAWKIDSLDRLLLRAAGTNFFYPVATTQCLVFPQGAFIKAKAANAREANLYQILLRKMP